jgi:hypothetical protein
MLSSAIWLSHAQGLLTSDAYTLALDTCTWTKLAPNTSRAFGKAAPSQPRINHCAVAVPQAAGALVFGELLACLNIQLSTCAGARVSCVWVWIACHPVHYANLKHWPWTGVCL